MAGKSGKYKLKNPFYCIYLCIFFFFVTEILKNNSELAERKNDPTNYPPYLAVQHVRDQLIPIAKR